MYVKLIAREGGYYQAGTEVFDYDGKRFTVENYDKGLSDPSICVSWKDDVLVRGINQDGNPDGELSHKSEFDVTETEEYREMEM